MRLVRVAGSVQAAAARVCDEDGGVRAAAVALLRALACTVPGARMAICIRVCAPHAFTNAVRAWWYAFACAACAHRAEASRRRGPLRLSACPPPPSPRSASPGHLRARHHGVHCERVDLHRGACAPCGPPHVLGVTCACVSRDRWRRAWMASPRTYLHARMPVVLAIAFAVGTQVYGARGHCPCARGAARCRAHALHCRAARARGAHSGACVCAHVRVRVRVGICACASGRRAARRRVTARTRDRCLAGCAQRAVGRLHVCPGVRERQARWCAHCPARRCGVPASAVPVGSRAPQACVRVSVVSQCMCVHACVWGEQGSRAARAHCCCRRRRMGPRGHREPERAWCHVRLAPRGGGGGQGQRWRWRPADQPPVDPAARRSGA